MMKRDRAVLLAALIALGAWTAATLTPPLGEIDLTVTRWLQQYASPALDLMFSALTIAGNIEISIVIAGLLGVALIRTGQTRLAILLWGVFAGGSGLEWFAKHWFPHPGVPESLQRHGINVWHYWIRTPYSYVSGHAFRTLLLATAVPWTWVHPPIRSRRLLPYVLGMAVVLIGVALVYLGDHWLSEVIGGYLLAAVGIALLRVLRFRGRRGARPPALQITRS